MKKKLQRAVTLIIAALFIVGLAFPADASTGYKIKSSETTAPTQYSNIGTETHNVVTGYAAAALGSWASNDWDWIEWYGSLTAAEQAWVNAQNLGAGTHWYLDATGQTIGTSMFQGYTETVGQETTSVEEFIKDSSGHSIGSSTTHYTTILQQDVAFQLVAEYYDSSPLTLDLNKDTKIDVARNNWMKHAPKFYGEYARMFDITGDGVEDLTEWMAAKPGDGLLAIPENGKVDTALQLFGTAGGYLDGYEKLSILCDKDKNGWVEGKELEGLAIWVDGNNNSKCEPNELKSLSDFNVTRLSTKHTNYVSSYKTDDGKVSTMWDWWPCVKETRKFRR
ncbi:MAG: hypothetical protein RDV48_01330 [Candidatus Eremiobacteraeota bacterium]|nr:hypothetical protein [Candidatus Eremiobacteraeota bacterium]